MFRNSAIQDFLQGSPYAVVGASRERFKYGNKVFRCFLQNQRKAYAVNPNVAEVEGITTYATLASLPEPVWGVSIITPPSVTESIIEQAGKLGIKHVWMQPGAESQEAIQRAEQFGMNVIAGGPCILVVMHYREASGTVS